MRKVQHSDEIQPSFTGKKAIIYTVAEKSIVLEDLGGKVKERVDREIEHNVSLLKHFAKETVGIHPDDCIILSDCHRINAWQDSKKSGFSKLMDGVLLGGIRDIIIKHAGELTQFQDDMLALVFQKMSVRLHILEYHKESPLSYYEESMFGSPLSVLVRKDERSPRPFESSKHQITLQFQKADLNYLDNIGKYQVKFDQLFKYSQTNVFKEEDIAYIASEALNNGSVSMLRMQEIQRFFSMGALRFTPEYGLMGLVQTIHHYTDNSSVQSQGLKHVGFPIKIAESIKQFFDFVKEQENVKKPDYSVLAERYNEALKLNHDAPHSLKVLSASMSAFYYDARSMSGILSATKAYRDMLENLYRFFTSDKVANLPIAQSMGENYLKHNVEKIKKDLAHLIQDTNEYLNEATVLYQVTENHLAHFHESLLLLDNYRRKWATSMLLAVSCVLNKQPDGFLQSMSATLNKVIASMSNVKPFTSEFARSKIDKEFDNVIKNTASYLSSKAKSSN